MAANTTASLEALMKIVQAAHNTDFSYPSEYTRGITTGLRIALDAIGSQLLLARDLDAASQNQ